ncbi:uncharacterized protein LOC131332242 [Rhododendron vialii]|uniref:uncharacterized protein LOC131332242 n=1 Tax=Rhododendron vialii TaxID=182163 RepID=UPI00265FBD10|nr:uncharacterized protein LOC131332242 [Rhododendron vialii]
MTRRMKNIERRRRRRSNRRMGSQCAFFGRELVPKLRKLTHHRSLSRISHSPLIEVKIHSLILTFVPLSLFLCCHQPLLLLTMCFLCYNFCYRRSSFSKAMDSSNATMPRYKIRVCGCNLQRLMWDLRNQWQVHQPLLCYQ